MNSGFKVWCGLEVLFLVVGVVRIWWLSRLFIGVFVKVVVLFL